MAKKENQADFMKMFNEEPQAAPVQPLPKKKLSPVGYEKEAGHLCYDPFYQE